ncbi:flagellar P-ring protein [Shewanella hanedai]|uniref:Flagellar P-ring protein n=1 Tax=Shewanella hanedai TaxID=25 RepID=A0A553JUY1_SHEHA|nr:flagellar basal body P-ring protein FlgI [Shewanella hanedai]TRY16263.1 flagellar basal body P-ring protein FlgI [Shewanella hanedai]GGI67566.1 flagellar P-ring protein [Shewanella hanedai]
MNCRKLIILLLLFSIPTFGSASQVTVKDVARIYGVRDTALVGYGLVTGLAGSGDSARFSSTSQSLKSVLRSFDVNIEDKEVQSRNVAAVIVTASIPAFAEIGDKLDVQVSSLGDARSLSGGTLLLSPLKAPNDVIYALAQGQITVGGYRFEEDQNVMAKNHATVGNITRGATTERSVVASIFSQNGSVSLILNTPDFTMLDNVTMALRHEFPRLNIQPVHAGKLDIGGDGLSLSHLAKIEQVKIKVAQFARIVVNERSGIIVSGSDIPVSSVVISHGNLNLKISSTPRVSQPDSVFFGDQSNIKTVTVRDTEIQVNEQQQAIYINKNTTTIAEVVSSLQKLNISTRDMISILEGLKRSGALHAEIVIQ